VQLPKYVVAPCLLVGCGLVILFLPAWATSVLVAVLVSFSLYEFYVIFRVHTSVNEIALGALIFCAAILDDGFLFKATLVLCCLAVFAESVFRYGRRQPEAPRLFIVVLGWIYIPVCLSYVSLIRSGSSGEELTLVLLAATSVRNMGAGVLGPYLPGPSISFANSKKTYGGAVAGLLAVLVVLGLVKLAYFSSISNFDYVVILLIASVFGQLGDLFESALKRSAGVGESSKLLGGQGGFLDTIDSFVFTAPATYYYMALIAPGR